MAFETSLLEVGIMFAALAAAGAVASRAGQSVIPLYIVVGLVLSESVAGDLAEQYAGATFAVGASETAAEFVELGAELGIVFLLFFLGLEFNLDRLLAAGGRITRAGVVDLGINFGAGFVLGYAVFGAVLPAFLLAGMVYISSSAIITKSLIDRGWIANPEAEPMLGTLVFEDLVIAVYLAVAAALVTGADGLASAAPQIGLALAVIAALLLVAYFGTAAFQRMLRTETNEYVVLRAVGTTVLVAGAALTAGVSEAVAAFFVGMAFSGTDHVQELENLLEPLRDTFAAVFFFWIGLVTDPATFLRLDVLGLIAAAVLVTTPTKLLSGFWGGRIYGLDDRRSTRVALGMTTRGEFTLIIAALLAGRGLAPALAGEPAAALTAFAVGYVLVMSVLGTTLMQHSGAVESFVQRRLAGG